MAVHLPADVEANILRQKIERGDYPDAGKVAREALRLLDLEEIQLVEHRAKLQVGLDQLERGEGVEWTPALMEQLSREADEMHRRGDRPDPDVCP